MTPKEKAQELVDKYYQLAESIEWTDEQTSLKAEKFNDELGSDVLKYWNELSKQSALIAVDEIIKVCPYTSKENCETRQQLNADNIYFVEYWNEVKQEIEKL